MYSSDELLQKVNAALHANTFHRQPETLYEPIRYALSMGGKRLRPVLLLMAYNLYRDDVTPALDTALGVETYHNFTLLHDDLMDRAEYRRGKPCVHRVWNDNAAIMSGDTMLMLAARHVAQTGMFNLMDYFLDVAVQVYEGQQYDMEFETRNDVTEDEYMEMIRLKTSVLLAGALKLGAMQADAPLSDQEALYAFGEKLGLAFQLQDDYLDVYGDFATFGKRPGGDILCNKKTFMLINALNSADDSQRQELERWIKATTFVREEKIMAVTRLYDELGIRQRCEQRIAQYFDEAKALLDKVAVASERKQELRDYTAKMMQRNY